MRDICAQIHLRTKRNRFNTPCHFRANTQYINLTSWGSSFPLKLLVLFVLSETPLVVSPLFCCSCCSRYELSTFFLCCSEYELDIPCILFSPSIYPPSPYFFILLMRSSFGPRDVQKMWSGGCFFALSVCNRVHFPSSINPFILLQSPNNFLFCVM